jgi:hypothetical protein
MAERTFLRRVQSCLRSTVAVPEHSQIDDAKLKASQIHEVMFATADDGQTGVTIKSFERTSDSGR